MSKVGIFTSDGLKNFSGGSNGHTIVNENGTAMSERSNLKFVGATVTDDLASDTTIISIEGGGGIELDAPTAISFTNLDEAVTIKWTDPTDLVVDGRTLATWAGTLVVRKIGSAPEDKTDGTLVIDEKTRNQYQTTGFTDTGLTNGVTYYYGFFPYSTQKVYNTQTAQSFTPSIIYPTAVSDLSVSAANESATVSWSVPSDATRVRIVYKADSAPESDTDGTYFEDVASPHELTGLTNGTTYYFVAYSYNAKNRSVVSGTVNATPQATPIYGVEWDGTSTTAWSRTDSAENFPDPNPYYAGMTTTPGSPFDSISPWKDMVKSERTGGTVVSIPKFYYKWTKSGKVMKLQIIPSDYADWAIANGYSISPAHMDRGDGKGERDIVYVGRYHCSSSNYKSVTKVTPKVKETRATFRTNIHKLGSTIWQYDYATLITIWMLYLVEFANWNSQAKIGYGCAPNGSTSEVRAVGYTDSMPYHTGTDQTSKTTYGGTQYRYLEGLWDNCFDWCDGIYFSGANIYAIKNPASFSDNANGTLVGTRPTSGNYISEFNFSSVEGFKYFLYPSAVSGSESTYISDCCNYSSSGVVLFVGGNYSQSQHHGLFYLNGDYSASSSHGSVGSRILELP